MLVKGVCVSMENMEKKIWSECWLKIRKFEKNHWEILRFYIFGLNFCCDLGFLSLISIFAISINFDFSFLSSFFFSFFFPVIFVVWCARVCFLFFSSSVKLDWKFCELIQWFQLIMLTYLCFVFFLMFIVQSIELNVL